MAKVSSTKSPAFAQGGPAGGMVGRTGATVKGPGTTAKESKGKGGKFATGGGGGMHGRSSVTTRRPGTTGGQ